VLAADFVSEYPRLYHTTNSAAWPLIEKHGLLSAKSICERTGMSHSEVATIIRQHRTNMLPIGEFVLRDNKPLRLHNLRRNLEGSQLTVEDWLALLNERVFFHTSLTHAAKLRHSYITEPMTILTIDTARLFASHGERVEISTINSGAARMPFHTKSRDSFQSLTNFVMLKKAQEVTVLKAIPNLREMQLEVKHLNAGIAL